MPRLQVRQFADPDELRQVPKATYQMVKLDDAALTRRLKDGGEPSKSAEGSSNSFANSWSAIKKLPFPIATKVPSDSFSISVTLWTLAQSTSAGLVRVWTSTIWQI